MGIEVKNSTTYKVDNLGEVKPSIIIGGSDVSKFVPNVNMSFHDNEFYINLNRRNKVVTTEISGLSVDGKISQKVGDDTDEYYIKDGKLKWDIVFDKLPKSMDVDFDITNSKGLEFLYQLKLIAEEIEDGCIRPDDIVGSYAVYCGKSNNKYKTGKVCHITRPFVIDVKGKTEWCVLNISEGILKITLPDRFMDVAEYPVRLDPNFGYETTGATEHYIYNSSKPSGSRYDAHTAAMGDTITRFSLYCRRYAATNTIANVAAYTVSGTVLDARLGSSTEITVDSATDQWFNSGACSIEMTEDDVYGLAVECYGEADGVVCRYDSGGSNYYTRHNAGASLPATWTSDLNTDRILSIYATYTGGITPLSWNVQSTNPITEKLQIVDY